MTVRYGYCAMTADFLHIGHIEFLKECKEHCDKLIVGIMIDDYVIKHKRRIPIMNQYKRADLVASVRYVDTVIFQEEFDYSPALLAMKDFNNFKIIDSDENAQKRKGVDIIIKGGIDRRHGISSTQKIESLDNC